jgi:hypothetical protein
VRNLNKALFFIYFATWLCIAVFSWMHWNELSWWQKSLLVVGEIFFAPDISSLQFAFFRKR